MDIAFPRGTSIEVRDLFFNLPARRKFLRSDRSELGLIAKYVTNAALASPGVRFILTHGPTRDSELPGGGGPQGEDLPALREGGSRRPDGGGFHGRGRAASRASLPGRSGDGPTAITSISTSTRRPVKDRTLQAALNQAYAGILEKDRSAEAFLFLTVPFSEVDVNVHPAKAEVRFRDSQAVFRLILRSVETGGRSG